MATVGNVDMSGWRRQSSAPFLDGNNPNQIRSGTRQNLIFEDVFDGGTLDSSYWNPKGVPPTIQTRVGETVLEAVLDRDIYPNTKRSEAIIKGLPASHFDFGQNVIIGSTIWYGFSIYLPAGFVEDTLAEELFTQWHGSPDTGEDFRNPPLALYIKDQGSNVYIQTIGDSKEITPGVGTANRYTDYDIQLVGTVASMIGKWTSWVFKVKWAIDGTGELDLYKDGVSVYSATGINNCYNDVKGPNWRIGVYKWAWLDENPPSDVTLRTYYYDNVRVGDENATLADMWTDHS